MKEYGKLNILVNNAGIYGFTPVVTITAETFYNTYNINVLGALYGVQEAIKAALGRIHKLKPSVDYPTLMSMVRCFSQLRVFDSGQLASAFSRRSFARAGSDPSGMTRSMWVSNRVKLILPPARSSTALVVPERLVQEYLDMAAIP
jgi:NAD(P)-dependent dehydrogenase (short-subunit alcohol dehydrogenase family)